MSCASCAGPHAYAAWARAEEGRLGADASAIPLHAARDAVNTLQGREGASSPRPPPVAREINLVSRRGALHALST
jgi:hypothetical protein